MCGMREEIYGKVIYCFRCWEQVNKRVKEIMATHSKAWKGIGFVARREATLRQNITYGGEKIC